MSRFVRLLLLHGLLVWLAGAALPAAAATYTAASTTYSWDTVSTSAGVSGDDVSSAAITLPFSFPFGGTAQTKVYISSNGLIAFTAANTGYTNGALPQGTAPTLMPYWDDLRTDLSGSAVTYGTLGSAPNRRFVVTWTSAGLFANNAVRLNFQAVV